jgi:hypothetical protein
MARFEALKERVNELTTQRSNSLRHKRDKERLYNDLEAKFEAQLRVSIENAEIMAKQTEVIQALWLDRDQRCSQIVTLMAELKTSRKRQRDAEDLAASGIKVKQEVVEAEAEALQEGERARKRARVAERRAEEAEDRGQCGICFERDADTVLQPCGHRVCGVCAGQLSVCPYCQGAVTDRQKTFE